MLAATVDGSRLLRRALEVRAELLSDLTAEWPDTDAAKLAELLERLGAGITEMENRA